MTAPKQRLAKATRCLRPVGTLEPELNENIDAYRTRGGIRDAEPVSSIGKTFKAARMDAPTRYGYLQLRAATATQAAHG